MIQFFKYQGTGNDFILIDNREGNVDLTNSEVAALCHRRFGIGADGLMLLEQSETADFHMVYYNSDGNQSTMCGNGGRCIAAFAKALGIADKEVVFTAIDGLHKAYFLSDNIVSLEMQDVSGIREQEGGLVLDTGSPHFIAWVDGDIQSVAVFSEGRRIRNLPAFQPGGLNVNFVARQPDHLWVRTYERGVEDETYSCGTGVTAAAIAASGDQLGKFNTKIITLGGDLEVSFDKISSDQARNVMLTGPAKFVFKGTIELNEGSI